MAVKRGFTVDEVIDHVAIDGVSVGEPESVLPSVEDVIKVSVDQFNPLRESVDNMFQFRREASSCLEKIYKKHQRGNCELEGALLSVISVGPTRCRNPWCIEFTRYMPKEIFPHLRGY